MERTAEPGAAGPSGPVDIAVCTYRRESVADTLRSIAAQVGVPQGVRVIVVDNDDTACAELRIRQAARDHNLTLAYRHAPARNISLARNAALDSVASAWFAFLDDDEIASPGWLNGMLVAAASERYDAVLGPVQGIYGPDAASWLKEGDFHSTRPVIRRGDIHTGYSGNVLIRREFLKTTGLRFDPGLGRCGGEDVDFFYRFRDAGGRIGFAPEALVDEPVPAHRARLDWLVARNFRAGQTHGARLARSVKSPVDWLGCAVPATAKAAYCGLGALAHAVKPVSRNRFITRGALHLGVVARVTGVRELELY